MAAQSQDKAFEIFVKRAISSIQKEAWGRSKEVKDLRDSCQQFLTTLEAHEQGTISFDGSLAVAVLQPLQLACVSNQPKIMELALGCLHKLVAHAWLQGESSTSPEGLLIEDTDVVAQVIRMVLKCSEGGTDQQQIAVIRALLTFTTAEHFIAHGESLMAAVRTVFNLALGCEHEDTKRTACNALLQMLNTITKRVTAYHVSHSACASRRVSDMGTPLAIDDAAPATPPRPGTGAGRSSVTMSPAPLGQDVVSLSGAGAEPGGNDDGATSEQGGQTGDLRTAQFASLAEQRDIRGLEAAIGASGTDDDDGAGAGGMVAPQAVRPSYMPPSSPGGPEGAAQGPQQGFARASIGSLGSGTPVALSPRTSVQHVVVPPATPPAVPRTQLSVSERDVLLVLTAFCKLASRESGVTEVESYLHQGKLLALELLVKVLQNPQHSWAAARDDFCRHLRQPLCITLLRNCSATDPAAFQLAIKLLAAVMLQPQLRRGLKAELGAFYPLFLLGPLEQEGTDLHTLLLVMASLKALCADPQLVVDLFVNYDCDLQAPNLYERTMQAFARLSQLPDAALTPPGGEARAPPPGGPRQPADTALRIAAVRELALKCIMSVVGVLDLWAGPIKEGQARVMEGEAEASSSDLAAMGNGTTGEGGTPSEAEAFEAAKQHKASLERGVALFNGGSPVKAIRYLRNAGLLDSTPQAVAAWIRQHAAELDSGMVGELFGHHEEFEIRVMHAWVDMERYAGLPIDFALRKLLEQFRLPGEAQKIDRIMEKFAERYCRDNPTKFRNADAAYVLSFAIIMLNTDAHNPLAERRLGKQDFVVMNYQTTEDEGMVPVLPVEELEAIYDRIVAFEIILKDGANDRTSERKAAAQQQRGGSSSSSRNRLAAALGLRQISNPFKPLASGWDKKVRDAGEQERKRRVMELAERAVAKGAGGSWHTATHAEHARPMLTVSGACMQDALAHALTTASDLPAVDSFLTAMAQIVELAGLLGLDELGEHCVGVLCRACGVAAPAPPGGFDEARQLAALRVVVRLATGPGAGMLGGGWTTILRCLSALDALRVDLTRAVTPPPAAPPVASTNPLNKMFQALGFSLPGSGGWGGTQQQQHGAKGPAGGAADANGNGPAKQRADSSAGAHPDGHRQGSEAAASVRAAPGATLVMWAESEEGKAAIDQVYQRSVRLDGEAVVVFLRALCAVSREELDLGVPRLTSLQRLVECAHHNMGRIRFIWARIWSVISAHLVMAACHVSTHVAMLTVDSLRQLMTKLLSKTELTNFTYQGEALRPFVAVLRQCDHVTVREAVVRCVAQAVDMHRHDGSGGTQPSVSAVATASEAPSGLMYSGSASGLGSGWRMVVEVVRRALADPAASVALLALDMLQVVVGALYRGGGHLYFRECLNAILAAVHNGEQPELGPRAVQLLLLAGQRLAEHQQQQQLAGLDSQPGGGRVVSFKDAEGSGAGASSSLLPWSSGALRDAGGSGALPLSPAGSGAVAVAAGVEDSGRGLLARSASRDAEDGWALMLQVLSDILASSASSAVVGSATAVLFSLLQGQGQLWSPGAWQVMQQRVVPHLFKVPPGLLAQSSSGAPLGPEHTAAAQDLLSRVQRYFPPLCDQLGHVSDAMRPELLQQLTSISLQLYTQAAEQLAVGGLSCLERLAHILAGGCASGRDVQSLHMLLEALHRVVMNELQVVFAATQQLHAEQAARPLIPSHTALAPTVAVGVPPRAHSAAAAAAAAAVASIPATNGSSSSSSVGTGSLGTEGVRRLRCRSHMALALQRLLAQVYGRWAPLLPWPTQSRLLGIMLECSRHVMAFNLQLAVSDASNQQRGPPPAAVARSPLDVIDPATAGVLSHSQPLSDSRPQGIHIASAPAPSPEAATSQPDASSTEPTASSPSPSSLEEGAGAEGVPQTPPQLPPPPGRGPAWGVSMSGTDQSDEETADGILERGMDVMQQDVASSTPAGPATAGDAAGAGQGSARTSQTGQQQQGGQPAEPADPSPPSPLSPAPAAGAPSGDEGPSSASTSAPATAKPASAAAAPPPPPLSMPLPPTAPLDVRGASLLPPTSPQTPPAGTPGSPAGPDGRVPVLLSSSNSHETQLPLLARLESEAALLTLAALAQAVAMQDREHPGDADCKTNEAASSSGQDGSSSSCSNSSGLGLAALAASMARGQPLGLWQERWHQAVASLLGPSCNGCNNGSSHEQEKGADAADGGVDVAATARQLLSSFCLQIVVLNAAAATALRNSGGVSSATGPWAEQAPIQVGQAWHDSIRAPYVAQAVLLLLELPELRRPRCVTQLFETMLALMQHQQATVRAAVAEYMEAAVYPLLLAAEGC